MRLVLAILFAGFFTALTVYSTWRLAPRPGQWGNFRWLTGWFVKGFIVPLAIWLAMNLGVSLSLQPFMPSIQAAQKGGSSWLPSYFAIAGAGLFVVSTFWCAATMAWTVWRRLGTLRDDLRSDFQALCLTSLAGMAVPAVIILYVGGLMGLGLAGIALLVPIVGYGPGILRRFRLPPMYAKAVTKIKFGKYSEAEWDILQELEKCETDFDGWMMLAELYARQFNDLTEAESTILEICDGPEITPTQLSLAMHKLADWRLNLAGDPEAAARALQVICQRLPGTHLAHMAQLRVQQLPASREELQDRQAAHKIRLPALSDSLQRPENLDATDTKTARTLAVRLAERLKAEPENIEIRERLAYALAEQLGKPGEAIGEIEYLLNLRGQPEIKSAEWLGLIAAWQLRYLRDTAAAKSTLRRITEQFANTPQARAAARRLSQMEAEQQVNQTHPKPVRQRIVIIPDAPLPPASEKLT